MASSVPFFAIFISMIVDGIVVGFNYKCIFIFGWCVPTMIAVFYVSDSWVDPSRKDPN